MSVPNDRHYTDAHVWLKEHDQGLMLGITEHAQTALGTVEALELPPLGSTIAAGTPCGSIESLKTLSDLIAPIDAEVIQHNADVISDPALVNDDPYEEGWLLILGKYNAQATQQLLAASAYHALIE